MMFNESLKLFASSSAIGTRNVALHRCLVLQVEQLSRERVLRDEKEKVACEGFQGLHNLN